MSNRLRVKSVSDVLSNLPKLKPTLGLIDLVFMGIGCIVGAGLFVVIGKASADYAGPAVILSFILAAFVVISVAFSYAELSSMIPSSGSVYTYVYTAFGEAAAWVVFNLFVLTYCSAGGYVSIGWSGYVVSLLRDFGILIPTEFAGVYGSIVPAHGGGYTTAICDIPAAVITLFCCMILARGMRESAIFNAIIVCAKVGVILVILIIGSFYVDYNLWIPFIPENTGTLGEFGVSGIVAGSTIILGSYCGFEVITSASQEAHNPSRDVPRAIVITLLICATIYSLTALVVTGLVHYKLLGVSDPIALAIVKMNKPWLSVLVKLGIIIGLFSVILMTIYGVSRVILISVQDGLLPKCIGKIDEKTSSPHLITLIVSLVIMASSSLLHYGFLAKLQSFCLFVVFIIVCITNIYMRYKHPDLKRGFRVPFMPFSGIIGVLACVGMLILLDSEVYLFVFIYMIVAMLFYLVYGMKNSVMANK